VKFRHRKGRANSSKDGKPDANRSLNAAFDTAIFQAKNGDPKAVFSRTFFVPLVRVLALRREAARFLGNASAHERCTPRPSHDHP